MRHVVSFLRSPIGYVLNLAVTVGQYLPGQLPEWAEYQLCAACEMFCLRDGVQDDPLF